VGVVLSVHRRGAEGPGAPQRPRTQWRLQTSTSATLWWASKSMMASGGQS
jgi:hypothetical protein